MSTKNPNSSPVSLTEDEIDDILYLARTNSPTDLSQLLSELSQKYPTEKSAILLAAIDPESKNTPLHYAAANGHMETLTLLTTLLKPLPPTFLNFPNTSLNTPLHWAALNGHLPFVQQLLRLGADASLTNAAGHDCVFEAELNGKTEVVEWLLREAVGLERGVGGEEGEGEGEVGDVSGEEKEGSLGGTTVVGDEEVRKEMEALDVNGEKKVEQG